MDLAERLKNPVICVDVYRREYQWVPFVFLDKIALYVFIVVSVAYLGCDVMRDGREIYIQLYFARRQ